MIIFSTRNSKLQTAHNTHVCSFKTWLSKHVWMPGYAFSFKLWISYINQITSKKGDSIPFWVITCSSIAHGCATIVDEVPSNSTINYAELCLKLCPMSIHLLLLCPEDASKFLPRSSVFVGWRMTGGRIWMTHDIMMTDDDWPSCFFPVILQVLSLIYSWQKDAKTGNYFLKQSSLFKLVN